MDNILVNIVAVLVILASGGIVSVIILVRKRASQPLTIQKQGRANDLGLVWTCCFILLAPIIVDIFLKLFD